jgi:hypothetical protein
MKLLANRYSRSIAIDLTDIIETYLWISLLRDILRVAAIVNLDSISRI